MTDIFLTSDQHFGHERIIALSKRPFASAADMDEALIEAWNAVVRHGDEVWCLGDFSMGRPEYTNGILRKLHGRKRLVLGNHDRVTGVEWSHVQESAEFKAAGRKFFAFHYPVRDWPGKWSGTLHAYGHVHGNLLPLPGAMEVSVDVWGGRPVSAEELVNAIVPFDIRQELVASMPLRHRPWSS